jgi:hypothetical protein
LSDSGSNQSQNDASAEAADTGASGTSSHLAAVLASNRANDLMLSTAVPPRHNNPIGMICGLDHSLFARLACV